MIFSRSSAAIWWVSLSESLEREVRILCFSSIMARWDEREEDGDFAGGVVIEVWAWDFEGFEDLGAWELIVLNAKLKPDSILLQRNR